MDENRKARLPVVAAVAVLLLLPLLYVLSVGPVILFIDNGYLDPDSTAGRIAERIYAPVEWLAGVCEPFKIAVTWYVKLWRRG